MPSGYTSGVYDGTMTELKDFALTCARAFGALVRMRDDPLGTEIPDNFCVSASTLRRVREAREAYEAAQRLAAGERILTWARNKEHETATWDRLEKDNEERAARYKAMITKVQAWQPPAAMMGPLKDFMLEQLRKSLDFDCKPYTRPEPKQPGEWWDGYLGGLWRAYERAVADLDEEEQRAKEATEWVQALKTSFDAKGGEE